MNMDQAERICETLADINVEAEVREEYSGRFMAEERPAVVLSGESRHLLAFGWAARCAGVPLEDLPQCSDSMGQGMVLY